MWCDTCGMPVARDRKTCRRCEASQVQESGPNYWAPAVIGAAILITLYAIFEGK